MKIGYVRVSTEEQNTARQEIMLRELGVDELFVDRASGKNADRPELNRMMNFVRRGDTVIVESISRFARNTRDLLDLVEQLTAKQVEFVSRKEAIDTTTPTGKFMLTVFAAVAGYCHRQTARKVPRPSAEGISGLRTHRSAVAEGRNHRCAGDEAARDEQDKILRASEAA